jgi:uncharacterized protein
MLPYPRPPFAGIALRRGLSGFGIFATQPIKKGTFVLEYWGPILNDEHMQKKGGKYLFELGKNKTIDGSSRKNTARYMNHACKPNCEVTIRGGRIYIYAIKHIKPGDELTYDYGDEYVREYIKPYGCRCATCKRK